ncbi:MAG: c-type cytochrome [Gemmataceae bacterium]|nr:c-type cytochrome [Gemmataceae bacterium]
MTCRLAPLALLLAAASPAAAQVPPDKTLATMQPAAGWQVELFAAEPLLVNPTSMDVDHKGRVWVAEAVNYRRKNFNRPILREEGDRIVVLVDTDGDGKADESKVFYQGKDLYGPLGVCVSPHADGQALTVYVCQSPDILVFEDKDGDLKADGPPKKLLTGFRGFDHDHGVHGLNIGPDGKLYFTVGDSGVDGLKSSDGKGRVWKSNDTDCRAGTVWRCDPDGTNLELIAHNFRNNYECCVDSFGEVWLSDNDDDGNQQTRICFVMPGGNYGYYPRGAGQTHWHEEQPGIVHKTLRTGFGSPTGITFNEGGLFGDKYRGALLHCDAGPREVRAFFRKPKGAGYELDKEVILTSSDNWFRPSDVTVAPDGSIFVCDWYDPGVGGHGMGDWTRGRVFRLTPKGHKGYKVPAVDLDKAAGVLAALGSPCQATRALALSEIKADPKRAADVVPAGMTSDDWFLAVRSHWLVFPSLASNDPAVVEAVTPKLALFYGRTTDPAVAAQLMRIVGRSPEGVKFGTASPDGSAAPPPGQLKAMAPIDREQLLLMRSAPADQVKDAFYLLAKRYDGQDLFYRAALNIACGTDPKRRDAILADFDKHFPEWNDTVADLVWELRPKSVLPRLGQLLADPTLTGPQKARIVDILAASDDPSAGPKVLAVITASVPPEVKARAIEHVKLFLPTKWKGLQGDDLRAAVAALTKNPADRATALQLAAATGSAEYVPLALGMAFARPEDVPDLRAEAVSTLGRLKSAESVAALKKLAALPDPTRQRQPLVAEALAAQVGNNPKDEVGRSALTALQGLAGEKDAETARAAVEALAGTRPGTIWLLEQHAAKKLSEPLTAAAGRLLRNSPYQDLRNKALVAFPAPGKLDPKKLPTIYELTRRTGDAARGEKVWKESLAGAAQCAKCHTVRGEGGQVGPDLSMIGVKGSRENLFESILNPSKAIADQYVQNQVTTAGGVTVTGLVVAEADGGVTIRDANGKDTVIPKDEVESRKKVGISIMPEDVVAALTEDELVDLVAYLETLRTAAYTPESFRVHGPYPADSMQAALDKITDPPAEGGKLLRPDAKGYFDLAALHGDAGQNSASYLVTTIESPVDQDAEVRLGTDDGAKLWVNGAEAFKTAATRAAEPNQETVRVKLKKGPNAIMLKVANGNNPHGAYFTVLSGQELKAGK